MIGWVAIILACGSVAWFQFWFLPEWDRRVARRRAEQRQDAASMAFLREWNKAGRQPIVIDGPGTIDMPYTVTVDGTRGVGMVSHHSAATLPDTSPERPLMDEAIRRRLLLAYAVTQFHSTAQAMEAMRDAGTASASDVSMVKAERDLFIRRWLIETDSPLVYDSDSLHDGWFTAREYLTANVTQLDELLDQIGAKL